MPGPNWRADSSVLVTLPAADKLTSSMDKELQPSAVVDRVISRALRELPLRNAPATLEARVFAAIAHRALTPWWRQSFLHWPAAARLVFLLVSIGFVRLGLGLTDIATSQLLRFESTTAASTLAPGIAFTRIALDLSAALNGALRATSAGIPTLWLYGGGLALMALYALFFGLSAVSYRAFRLSR